MRGSFLGSSHGRRCGLVVAVICLFGCTEFQSGLDNALPSDGASGSGLDATVQGDGAGRDRAGDEDGVRGLDLAAGDAAGAALDGSVAPDASLGDRPVLGGQLSPVEGPAVDGAPLAPDAPLVLPTVDAPVQAVVDAPVQAIVDAGMTVDAPAAPPCSLGSRHCTDNHPVVCEATGWKAEGTCPELCQSGRCVCSPVGPRDCVSNAPRTCRPDGELFTDVPCAGNAPICSAGACVECANGTRRCKLRTAQLCSNQRWTDGETCTTCFEGACVDHNGFWQGSTSQGEPLAFEVRGNGLAMFRFDWRAPGCGSIGGTATVFSPQASILAGSFDTEQKAAPPIAYRATGMLAGVASASGSIAFTYSQAGCTTDETLSFTAAKVICGDKKIGWPETCDDGNTIDGDGCSDLCRLPLTNEKEPNDDGAIAVRSNDFSAASAGGPFSGDTLVSGSLSPAGDEDTFALRNNGPAPVLVRIETHGPSMGTCPIDTELRIRDAGGTSLAFDDDAGLLSCSLLSYTIPPSTTVYLQVSEAGDDSAVAGYRLHIDFP